MNTTAQNFVTQLPSAKYKFILVAYNALWSLLLPILALVSAIKIILHRPGYDKARLARFSLFKHSLKSTEILWHCVSVGEVTAIAPLAKKILSDNPSTSITITTTTPTGAEQVERLLGGQVQHCYLPYDHYWLMSRLITLIQPQLLLITEVEIWPSLINVCRKRAIPSALVNARMTERSAQKYMKIGRFFSETIRQLSAIGAQSEASQQRYLTLGGHPDSTLNLGNIKFEIDRNSVPDDQIQKIGKHCQAQKKALMVAGSTHAPEEQMCLDLHEQLAETRDLVTCIVPRHPQRFAEVTEIIEKSGLSFWCYSQESNIPSDCEIVLVDTMGVMQALFKLADIAFVGGSFANRGGHNALEPALYSVPVVMGPSQHNNPQITSELESAGGLVTTISAHAMFEQLDEWLGDPQKRKQAGESAHSVIEQNRGALTNNMQLVQSLLSGKQDITC